MLEICYFYISQTKSSLDKIFYKIVCHHIICMCDFFGKFRRLFYRGLHGFSQQAGFHSIRCLLTEYSVHTRLKWSWLLNIILLVHFFVSGEAVHGHLYLIWSAKLIFNCLPQVKWLNKHLSKLWPFVAEVSSKFFWVLVIVLQNILLIVNPF